jgi:hypothetical protein
MGESEEGDMDEAESIRSSPMSTSVHPTPASPFQVPTPSQTILHKSLSQAPS